MRNSANRTQNERRANTLAQYLKHIKEVVEQLAPNYEVSPWFRGHRDETWDLLPGIYRQERWKHTFRHDYRIQFQQRALPYLQSTAREPVNEWDWYFLMQHYGLPTRLLDWTESSLTALYFALHDQPSRSNPNADAAVWVMLPDHLNKKVSGKRLGLLVMSDKATARYLPDQRDDNSLPMVPVAIDPPHNSRRIQAQKGVFVLFGKSRKCLNNYAAMKSHLKKITVPYKKIGDMKQELFVAGVTRTAMFPELDALCKELCEYWGYGYE